MQMTLYSSKTEKSMMKFMKILIQRYIEIATEINTLLYLSRKIFDR